MKNFFIDFFIFVFVFGLFLFGGPALAQSPAKFAWYEMIDGTRVMAPVGMAPAQAGIAARQAIWSAAVVVDGGLPLVSGTGGFMNPRGSLVPVTAASRVLGTGSAAAIGRALPKLLRAVSGPLVIGGILYDLGKELDFDLSKDGSGDLIVQSQNPDICTVAPCYEYLVTDSNDSATSGWHSTASAAALAYVIAYHAGPGLCGGAGFDRMRWTFLSISGTNAMFSRAWFTCPSGPSTNAGDGSLPVSTRSIAPASLNLVPSSRQAFLDAIAAKSGWPSGSNLAPVLRDALKFEPSPAVDIQPLVVSGPATSSGTVTTTTNSTNQTTKTSTSTYNHTYTGDTVSTTTTTTTTIINNVDNSVISEETTSTTNQPNPVNPCIENPDTLGCTKLGSPPDSEILPTLDVPVVFTPTSFGASGGCPTGISYSMMGKSYTLSYQPMCDLMSLLKPLFLALGAAAAAWLFMEGLKV